MLTDALSAPDAVPFTKHSERWSSRSYGEQRLQRAGVAHRVRTDVIIEVHVHIQAFAYKLAYFFCFCFQFRFCVRGAEQLLPSVKSKIRKVGGDNVFAGIRRRISNAKRRVILPE